MSHFKLYLYAYYLEKILDVNRCFTINFHICFRSARLLTNADVEVNILNAFFEILMLLTKAGEPHTNLRIGGKDRAC